MTPLPLTPDLILVAKRCVWFKSPVDALSNVDHLVAHVLTFGMHRDVQTLRAYLSDSELGDALDRAPPGIFDARSWAYWNWILLDRADPPPMPRRTFGDANAEMAA